MKIEYIISHGIAVWVKKDNSGSEYIDLIFKPKCNGAVILDGTAYPVASGEARLPSVAIRNGEHKPRLECEYGVIALSPFVKNGRNICLKEYDADTVGYLIKECHELDERLIKAEKTLAHLEEICVGHNIFNFERN